ncbi:MAG TPA: ester cyclase [Polyangia bacterium]|nr:ester cyclase [Polyangia bacterium]
MDNAQIARGVLEELFGRGNLDYVDQCFERTYRGHDTLIGEFGCDRLKETVQMYRQAFPDLSMKIDDLVSASDKVMLRWTARGTHKGPFLGRSATNRKATVSGISVMTFRNGKISEDYTQWDALGLLQELGIAAPIPELSAQPAAH